MGYEYFYQNIAKWLFTQHAHIDSPLQILILDNFIF